MRELPAFRARAYAPGWRDLLDWHPSSCTHSGRWGST